MATLRLFAQAREIAQGTSFVIEGESVGAVITAACERFGPEFVDVLDHSRIWLNGDECQPSDRVSPTDEIAVLPPVSGG